MMFFLPYIKLLSHSFAADALIAEESNESGWPIKEASGEVLNEPVTNEAPPEETSINDATGTGGEDPLDASAIEREAEAAAMLKEKQKSVQIDFPDIFRVASSVPKADGARVDSPLPEDPVSTAANDVVRHQSQSMSVTDDNSIQVCISQRFCFRN